MDPPAATQALMLDLPEELLESIILLLSSNDIRAFSATCTHVKNMIDSSARVQYQLTLEEAGYVNVDNRLQESASSTEQGRPKPQRKFPRSPHTGKPRPTLSTVSLAPWPDTPVPLIDFSSLSISEKKKALADREERWAKLEPFTSRIFHVRGRVGIYDLKEGVLTMIRDEELANGQTNHSRHPHVVRFIPLPAVNDTDLESTIIPTSAFDTKRPIVDVAMDPTQDLIVVSELPLRPAAVPANRWRAGRFHLYQMSTGTPHPLATRPQLDFPPMQIPTVWPRQLLQVMGETLAVLMSRLSITEVTECEDEIVVWNWKTGEVRARCHLGFCYTPMSFLLLTPTTLVVSSPATKPPGRPPGEVFPPTIKIFAFGEHTHENTNVNDEPLCIDPNDRSTPRFVQVATLTLPKLSPHTSVQAMDMRPEPSFPPVAPNEPTLGRGKPFTPDPGLGVVVFEFFLRGLEEDRHYELFVLRETFIKIASEGEERIAALRRAGTLSNSPTQVLRVYKWEEWGEHLSRLKPQLSAGADLHWICCCAGYRFASLCQVPDDGWVEAAPDSEADQLPPAYSAVQRLSYAVTVDDFSPNRYRRALIERGVSPRSTPYKFTATSKPPPPPPTSGSSEYSYESDSSYSSIDYSKEFHANYETVIHCEQTIIQGRNSGFVEPVTTRLPFVSVTRKVRGPAEGVMIDEQRIMVTRGVESEQRPWQSFTVWCM